MSDPSVVRGDRDRVVAATATGPVVRVVRDVAVVPWPSALVLLQELASRSMHPDAVVTSSIAQGLKGEDAFVGHAYVQGLLVDQLRYADVWSQSAVAAVVVGHVEVSGKGEGLEGLVASLANLLWGRTTAEASEDLLRLAVELTSMSRYTLAWPYFVAEQSGAVAAYDAGSALAIDEERIKKLLQKARKKSKLLKKIEATAKSKWLDALDPGGDHRHGPSKPDGHKPGDPSAGSQGGLGGWPKAKRWFGEDLERWVGDDLPLRPFSVASYAERHGLNRRLGVEAPLTREEQEARFEDGTWAEEPFHREDVTTQTEMESDNEVAKTAIGVGLAVTGIGMGGNKMVGEGIKDVAPEVGAVVAAAGVGILIGGGLVWAIDKVAGEQVYHAAGHLYDGVHWVSGQFGKIKAGEPLKMPNPMDDGGGAVDPVAVEKKIKQMKVIGLWPPIGPSDANDTNKLGSPVVREFNLVDPLDDPIDMIFADGHDMDHPPRKLKDTDEIVRRWIFYIGPGTASQCIALSDRKMAIAH